MQRWQDLIIISCNDCLTLPDVHNEREHQLVFELSLTSWGTVLALLISYWQDLRLPVGQFISPLTRLLLISLLCLSWLTHRYFRRYYPTKITQVHNVTEATYWRRQVLRRSLYDVISFTLIFLIIWLRQFYRQPHFTAVPWTGLVFGLIGVVIGVIFKYNRLIARFDFPQK